MRKKVKNSLIALLFLLIYQPIFCQEFFCKGYIISLKGDSIHGFIDYRNWDKNPNKVTFKTDVSNSKEIIYSPLEIIEFGVLDEKYVSAIVQTEMSSDKTDQLKFDPNLKIEIDTIFLQTIIGGSKSLYLYKNEMGKDQFYIRNDTNFEFLKHKKFLIERGSKWIISENKEYKNQLSVYFSDCPEVKSKIEYLQYNRKSLEKLFIYYYQNFNNSIFFHKKPEKQIVEIGINAGLSSTAIVFSSYYDNFPYLENINYPKSYNFTAGIFFDIIVPRNHKKWSLYNELTYSTYKTEGQYLIYSDENHYCNTLSKIGFSYLKSNNMLRFKYPIGHFYIFINGGVSNGVVIKETNYKKVESKFYSTTIFEEGKAINDIRKYEAGILIGIGLKFKKLSFDFRYEKGTGISAYDYLHSHTDRYYLLLGYRF